MGFKKTDKTKPVKRVIEGKAYNTATAELVYHTTGNDPIMYEFGDDYWPDEQELYRSRKGGFFILKRDMVFIGEEVGVYYEDVITPCTPDDAQEWLEKYCNEKVEDFFDIEEAGSGETTIALRTTDGLAKHARIMAKIKNQTLNTWLNSLIKEGLKRDINLIKAFKEESQVRENAARKLTNK